MILDLNDDETTALARLLTNRIDADRYPLSPRIQTLKGILAKLRPEPARESLPPPKVYIRRRGPPNREGAAPQGGERRGAIPVLSMPEPLVQ
jgi:hypothetical protein